MEHEEFMYLLGEKKRIDKHLVRVYGKDLTEPIERAVSIAERVDAEWERVKNSLYVRLPNEQCITCCDYKRGWKDAIEFVLYEVE